MFGGYMRGGYYVYQRVLDTLQQGKQYRMACNDWLIKVNEEFPVNYVVTSSSVSQPEVERHRRPKVQARYCQAK